MQYATDSFDLQCPPGKRPQWLDPWDLPGDGGASQQQQERASDLDLWAVMVSGATAFTKNLRCAYTQFVTRASLATCPNTNQFCVSKPEINSVLQNQLGCKGVRHKFL